MRPICHTRFGQSCGVISRPALPQGILLLIMSSPISKTSREEEAFNPTYHKDSMLASQVKCNHTIACAHVIEQQPREFSRQRAPCRDLGQSWMSMRGTIWDSFTRSRTDMRNMRGATLSKMQQQDVVLIRICASILLPCSGHSFSLSGVRATACVIPICLLFHQ